MGPVRVAIVGLGFGAEFIPIYQAHPNAEMAAICRRDRAELDACGDRWKVAKRFTDFKALLDDPEIDAVHINSPIPDHAWMSVAALDAGKHVACTVPMGTTVEECRQIVEAARRSGKVYTMMETVVYAREFLFVKSLFEKGELGRVQFLRGSHQQKMEGWPGYWEGLPPMHYATHCVSPCLALLNKHAESVVCHGSGRIAEPLVAKYGSPFAIETATVKVADSDVCFEVLRSLFNVARQYRESFDVYGEKASVEWPLVEHEPMVVHRDETPEMAKATDFGHLLPGPVQKFTTKGVYDADDEQHLSFIQGAGHGGSHPHLAHMFVEAARGAAPPFPDAETSANWTMVGICAHESAMKGGERVAVPTL